VRTARITVERITNRADLSGRWRARSARALPDVTSPLGRARAYDIRRSAVEAKYDRQLRTIIAVPACSTVMA